MTLEHNFDLIRSLRGDKSVVAYVIDILQIRADSRKAIGRQLKLHLRYMQPIVECLVRVPAPPVHLCVNVHTGRQQVMPTAAESLHANMRVLDWIPSFWILSSPVLAVVRIWKVIWLIKKWISLFLSFHLCLLPPQCPSLQIKNYF